MSHIFGSGGESSDRANFCQTCGHQFALKVVKAKGSRVAVIFFLFGIATLVGAYLLVRLNSTSNVAPVGNASQPVAVLASPSATPTPLTTPWPTPITPTPTPADTGGYSSVETPPVPIGWARVNYTEDALGHKVNGVVRARVWVGPAGKAIEVKLLKHLSDDLDAKAIKAVQDLTFVPATRDGQPASGWVTVSVEFRLQ